MSHAGIDALMDGVKWAEVHHEIDPSLVSDYLPHVTHSGVFKLYDFDFRVYQLSNGQRIIDGQDLEEFFNS